MKKMNILVASLLLAATATAQELKLSSQVRGTNGLPISGAIISMVGDKNTALSDEHGNFTLTSSNKNAIVSIKAQGFCTKELPLQLLKSMSKKGSSVITLIPENAPLYSEHVTTSTGKHNRYNKSATVQAVDNKDFTEKQDLGAALRDNIAGLQVIEKSGMPGEGSYMNVRGIHSFVAENNPLVVINGVPYFGYQDVSSVITGYSRGMLFGL